MILLFMLILNITNVSFAVLLLVFAMPVCILKVIIKYINAWFGIVSLQADNWNNISTCNKILSTNITIKNHDTIIVNETNDSCKNIKVRILNNKGEIILHETIVKLGESISIDSIPLIGAITIQGKAMRSQNYHISVR